MRSLPLRRSQPLLPTSRNLGKSIRQHSSTSSIARRHRKFQRAAYEHSYHELAIAKSYNLLLRHEQVDARFQPKCFEHFKPEFSGQLNAGRRKVYGGIPSQERKALAEARALVIKMFVQDPMWAE